MPLYDRQIFGSVIHKNLFGKRAPTSAEPESSTSAEPESSTSAEPESSTSACWTGLFSKCLSALVVLVLFPFEDWVWSESDDCSLS